MTLEIRRASDRFRTVAAGRETWHSFSFGAHYDPANVSFGPMVALNDERLEPGAGYDTHAHRGVELVTWVIEGSLVHRDSSVVRAVLPAGTVQVHSAGTGIEHSEHAGPGPGSTRFVQAWLTADEEDSAPVRRVLRAPEVASVVGGSAFVPVVSGSLDAPRDAPLGLGVAGATLRAVALASDAVVPLPEATCCHLFLATGAAELLPGEMSRAGGMKLAAGDAVRIVEDTGWSVVAAVPSLVLAWTFSGD